MRTSETFNELAAALAKAQGAIENAEKDRENIFLKNRYMTLTAVWDAIRKPLSDNGLSIVQVTEADDGALMLLTRLMHSSGQYIEATYPVLGMDAKGVNAAQAAGSALTYARRYSLTSMIGVVADEDDDAASATGKQPKPSTGPTWTRDDETAAALESAKQHAGAVLPQNGKQAPATKHEPPAQRPWSAPDAIAMIRAKSEYNAKRDVGVQVTDGKLGALIGLMDSQPWNTDDRHNFLNAVFGATSVKAITDANRAALVQWGNPMKTGPEKEAPWAWDANAQQEYAAVVKVNRSFLTDAELDGTDMQPAEAGEGDDPGF